MERQMMIFCPVLLSVLELIPGRKPGWVINENPSFFSSLLSEDKDVHVSHSL